MIKLLAGFYTLFIVSLVRCSTQLMALNTHPNQSMNDMSPNELTTHSYELCCNEYIAGTPDEVSESFKTWINATLKFLSPNAQIIEIGSAFGRDAKYIESFGFAVERTDATEAFVSLLCQKGYSAHKFNILTDDFTASYDLVFANCVFLHFTPQELRKVFSKIYAALRTDGILSFSLKKGEGKNGQRLSLDNPAIFAIGSWTKSNLCWNQLAS